MKLTRSTTVCVKADDSSDTIGNRHTKASDSCRCEVADGAVLTVVPDILSHVSSLYSLGLPHTDRVVLVSQVNSSSIVVVKSLNLIGILSEVLQTTTGGKSFTTTLYLGDLGAVSTLDFVHISSLLSTRGLGAVW